jgi:tetratricopeptide (TPR) repeat protein
MLVARGADPNLKSNKQTTVLERAIGGHSLLLTKTLIDCGASVDVDARYYDGTVHSLLYWAIVERQIESDRLDKLELAKIAKLLADRGAMLHSDEYQYVLSAAPELLGRRQIVAALDADNQATFSFKPTDPWLRKYVLKRIIGLAFGNLANARDDSYYDAALNCALLAKNRAEEWGMAREVPEVYFDCGLMARKKGNTVNAKAYLQKYLDLAPNAPNADRARELMSGN